MGAPPARLYELAVRLHDYGHEISVVTAFPNRPQGRIFEGYRNQSRMIEDMDGIRVIRTWIKPSASSASFLSRTINDLSWVCSSGLMSAKLLGKQDLIIVQNPPLFSVFSAKYLRWRTGAKIVMWCGDVWPDVLIQGGGLQPGMMTRFMHALQQYNFKNSDLLAVTNPKIAEDTQKAYRCPPVTVWSNGVDTNLFSPAKRSQAIRESFGSGADDILVGFVGLHGRFQGLDTILDAAAMLKGQPHIKFIFIGEGVDKKRLQAKAAALDLVNVTFHDPLPKSQMPGIVASCDISVVSLAKRMPGTMPSKFYEAIAAGCIPLVADGCEAAPLVRKYEAGMVYEPTAGESAAEAIRNVAAMGMDEREQVRSNAVALAKRFDREKLARFVESTLKALVAEKDLPIAEW
jgi:colanic acid biosynthesis glycosyl transferase WcaI